MSNVVETMGDLRILAAEDNDQARDLLRLVLQELGVRDVHLAKDGQEALDFLTRFQVEKVNLIICDWDMPRVSGLQVLRQVRAVDPDIPFMMLTGAADQHSVSVAKKDNVTSYLAKPYSRGDLEKKLKQIIRLLRIRDSTT